MVSDVFLGSALIHAYGKCKSVEGARRVFDDLVVKDVVSWTSLSSCYVNCGLPRLGLAVIREMVWNGVRPDSLTVSSILPACSELKDLNSGKAIHGFALRHEMVENVFVCSALVSMYARCLSVKQARIVFDLMPHRNVVSWNAVLTAYFTNKEYEKGLALFSQMSREGVKADETTWNAVIGGCMENGQTEEALENGQNMGFKPDQISISSILPACSILESLRMGKEVHCYVYRHWLTGNIISTTALVYMRDVDEEDKAEFLCNHSEKLAVAFGILNLNGQSSIRIFKNLRICGDCHNAIKYMSKVVGVTSLSETP